MKKIITMALIFTIIISQVNVLGVQAKESTVSELADEKETPSGIAYDELKDEITAFIEEREEGTASVSMAVFENQNTLYEIQHGFVNIDAGLKVDSETVYEWGSVTKMMVWVSVMQLYEQGLLDLDEDIRTYLPEGFLTKLSYDSPITMTNLMNHNAGWQETTYDVEVQDVSEIVELETALRRTEPAQIYEPGEVCAYSNWGATLAAYIVECIVGQDFGEYVHENIFKPLGMEHTSLAPDCSDNIWVQEQRERLNCYDITTDTYEDYGLAIRYILLYPAGAATGTLEDFITFAKAFVPKENTNSPLFQKKETLDLMLSATSYYGDSDIVRNSHGLWTLQYTVDLVGHNGNTAGCTSTLMFHPESGLGVVVMTNEVGETAYNYGFLSLIFGDYGENERVGKVTSFADLSGIYTLSRTYEKGYPALYKYIGALMPLSKTEENGVFKLSIGQGILTQVADNQYIMDNENGYRYLIYQQENKDGPIVLQMMGSDVIKQNTVIFWLKIASLLLMVIAVFYSIITCIVILIALLIRKVRKKEVSVQETDILKKSHIITLLVNALIGLVCYNLVIKPLDGGSIEYVQVMIQCIALNLLSVVPVGNMVILIKNRKICENCRKRKVKYIITAVFGCVLTLGIWYWQLFNFWSC